MRTIVALLLAAAGSYVYMIFDMTTEARVIFFVLIFLFAYLM